MSKIFNTFIDNRIMLIEQFSKINDQTLPSEEKWNAYQIAQHCYKVERTTLKSIESFNKKRSKFKLLNLIRGIILLRALKSDKKYVAPSKSVEPEIEINVEQLYKDWRSLDIVWKNVINLFQTQSKVVIFFHPIAGKLNLKYTLLFILFHLDHHLRQVKH